MQHLADFKQAVFFGQFKSAVQQSKLGDLLKKFVFFTVMLTGKITADGFDLFLNFFQGFEFKIVLQTFSETSSEAWAR
jgi:hypothetical protein